jgi:hypothetical protein
MTGRTGNKKVDQLSETNYQLPVSCNLKLTPGSLLLTPDS